MKYRNSEGRFIKGPKFKRGYEFMCHNKMYTVQEARYMERANAKGEWMYEVGPSSFVSESFLSACNEVVTIKDRQGRPVKAEKVASGSGAPVLKYIKQNEDCISYAYTDTDGTPVADLLVGCGHKPNGDPEAEDFISAYKKLKEEAAETSKQRSAKAGQAIGKNKFNHGDLVRLSHTRTGRYGVISDIFLRVYQSAGGETRKWEYNVTDCFFEFSVGEHIEEENLTLVMDSLQLEELEERVLDGMSDVGIPDSALLGIDVDPWTGEIVAKVRVDRAGWYKGGICKSMEQN